MKAVIYARYSSDSQREESIEGAAARMYSVCGKERHYRAPALH